METINLLARDSIIDSLRHAVKDGRFGLSDAPALLKRVLQEDAWQERVVHQTGEIVRFERFNQFVTTAPLEGLGATIELLQRLCRDDKEALDLIDRAMAGRQGERTDLFNIVKEVQSVEAPVGNSPAYALRRLRKDRPDLHKRVLSNELSPHAAMVEAGFRRPTVTIFLEPEAAARALKRHFDKQQLEVLIDILTQ